MLADIDKLSVTELLDYENKCKEAVGTATCFIVIGFPIALIAIFALVFSGVIWGMPKFLGLLIPVLLIVFIMSVLFCFMFYSIRRQDCKWRIKELYLMQK